MIIESGSFSFVACRILTVDFLISFEISTICTKRKNELIKSLSFGSNFPKDNNSNSVMKEITKL